MVGREFRGREEVKKKTLTGREDVYPQNGLNGLILNWCIGGCWFTPADTQHVMHKVGDDYSSCTVRSNENICSSSGGLQLKVGFYVVKG